MQSPASQPYHKQIDDPGQAVSKGAKGSAFSMYVEHDGKSGAADAGAQNPDAGLWDQGGFLPASQSDGATSFRSGPWHVALSGILLSVARASYAGHRKAGQTAASDSGRGHFQMLCNQE